MVVTYEPATDIVIPNIAVDRKYNDGVFSAYRLTPNEGYVLHDPTSDVPFLDEDGNLTNNYHVVYTEEAYIPIKYAPSTWTWEAVPKELVPKEQLV